MTYVGRDDGQSFEGHSEMAADTMDRWRGKLRRDCARHQVHQIMRAYNFRIVRHWEPVSCNKMTYSSYPQCLK